MNKTMNDISYWMQRSWRPISALVFVLIVFYTKLIAPVFSLPVAGLETDFWTSFNVILGVFGLTRGIEKTVKAADIVIKRKNETGN